MGTYDKWIGDIEDYTDEEVCDFNVGAVASTRIVRLRLAWRWVMVRRASSAMLPGESVVADVLTGGGKRRGQLRILAEELYALVTVPEDGEAVPLLGPWHVDDVVQLEIEAARRRKTPSQNVSLRDLAALYVKEVEEEMARTATMTKAIPRYNRSVRNSLFPQPIWGLATKQLFNRVLYRLDKERAMWNKVLEDLTVPSDGQ